LKKISLLGSTGSVGTQTLEVVEQHPNEFEIVGLSAGKNIDRLITQANKFKPQMVSVANKQLADQLKIHIPSNIEIVYGEEGLIEVATISDAEMVVTAILGSRGLPATLAAIDAGKQIGIANKETLVTAGHLVMERAKLAGVSVLPIDSEHSAVFQCLNGEHRSEIDRITLTASGGSFRDYTRDQLEGVTVEQALNHPNWSMGSKITIDSATMANKGLEVIEAHWLFGLGYENIDVLVHPESIIHSYVQFVDHSVIAQLGMPDMRVPIQYALSYPHRMPSTTAKLDLASIGKLTFREMDFERYPMLKLAYECGKTSLSAPIVYNAANEVAVDRFLRGEVSFLDIERIVEKALSLHNNCNVNDIEAILDVDHTARAIAATI